MTDVVEARSAEEILEAGETFIALRDQLAEDLAQTGFSPDEQPPMATEPKITQSLGECPDTLLKSLYDEFLTFYDYLSDQITRCEIYLETTKARADLVRAEVYKEVNKRTDLKNAEARESEVISHPAVISAFRDHLYFKQLYRAQEQRRKKLSKSMDRIYRELMLRTNDGYRGKEEVLSRADTGSRARALFRPISRTHE